MSSVRDVPRMTREEFLDWAEAHEIRYEFDGLQPVAMAGGTRDALSDDDVLRMPVIGIEIPIVGFYEGTDPLTSETTA